MARMNFDNYGNVTIREFLEHFFFIPSYQRDYAWDEQQFWELLEDLNKVIEQGNPHFFGQIVLTETTIQDQQIGNSIPSLFSNYIRRVSVERFCASPMHNAIYEIIDGQQRITTLYIALRCIYNELKTLKSLAMNERQEELYDNIVFTLNSLEKILYEKQDTNCKVEHLIVGKRDREWFSSNLANNVPPEYRQMGSMSHSRKLYCLAWKTFNEYIHNRVNNTFTLADKHAELDRIAHSILDNFYVLYLKAPDPASAFEIFESLNARGKDLAAADLLKNHLLANLTQNEVDDASEKWDSMIDSLGRLEPTSYIKCYWNATHDFVREASLYKSIARDCRTRDTCLNLLNNLSNFCPLYHDICQPDEVPRYFLDTSIRGGVCIDKKILHSLSFLKMLGLKTFYPLILSAIMKGCSKENCLKILERIETYTFRNIAVGSNPNNAEKLFSNLAISIIHTSEQNLPEVMNTVCQSLSNSCVDDALFIEGLKIGLGSNSSKIRYFFAKNHEFFDRNGEVNQNWNAVHIEHIMPKTLGENNWNHIHEDQHKEYLWNLGNLTLLGASINIQLRNGPYAEKRRAYEKDTIIPTRMIAERFPEDIEWNIDTIKKRCDYLAETALNIWPKQ